MNISTTSDCTQAEQIECKHHDALARIHGARYRRDRYVQPMHHHSYATSYRPHQREKIRRA